MHQVQLFIQFIAQNVVRYFQNIYRKESHKNMREKMGLLNMSKQEPQNICRKNNSKLNAKSVMQMKVNYITGHRNIYFQTQKIGQRLIFVALATENGMIL